MRNTLILVFVILSTAVAAQPLIGITVNVREGGYGNSLSVQGNVSDGVLEAGGIPVLLPPSESPEVIAHYLNMVDGFIFTGGADINPARWGQEQHETTNLLVPLRENFDLALMQGAIESDKPILGLCLGMQEMNVALGGSLIQDIPSMTHSHLTHRGATAEHTVEIDASSVLGGILGEESMLVNSSHHQAVDGLGEGLVITARSEDGIVEAIELPDRPFVIGIQWHAERMRDLVPHQQLFRSLIEAAQE